MVRSTISKVMWVGRATVFLVGLAVILAMVMGLASAALSATGGNFILGQSNSADRPTTLVGQIVDTAKSTLVLKNPNGGSALQLQVDSGQAPMKVNATAGKATNLDADELDGNDSSAFQKSGAAAGGDLSGTYPNPQITVGAVGSNEVASGSLNITDTTEADIGFGEDPPSINGGSCHTIFVSLAQADSGDYVLVNAPANLPSGLVAFPLNPVATAPQISIRLCNITSSAIDPPQATWRVAVFDDGNDI